MILQILAIVATAVGQQPMNAEALAALPTQFWTSYELKLKRMSQSAFESAYSKAADYTETHRCDRIEVDATRGLAVITNTTESGKQVEYLNLKRWWVYKRDEYERGSLQRTYFRPLKGDYYLYDYAKREVWQYAASTWDSTDCRVGTKVYPYHIEKASPRKGRGFLLDLNHATGITARIRSRLA